MALKTKLEKLDGLHPEVAKEYKKVDLQGGGHEFHLDAEAVGTFELTDVAPMKRTIETLRQFEDRVKKYGSVTPEEAIANKTKIGELTTQLEDARKDGKGGDERVKQVRQELEKTYGEQLSAANAASEARLKEVHRLRKYEAARAAAIEAGFKTAEELITPLLVGEIDVVENPTATREEDRFSTVVRGEGGAPRRFISKDTDRLLTVRERALELAKSEKFKRYVDVVDSVKETKDTKGTPKRPAQPAQPTDDKTQFVDPIQDLAVAFGVT